jgi:hypothetical protein
MYEYYEKLKSYALCIFVLYKKLARLEFEYKEETKEYEDTIKLINKLKKKEESIYDEIRAKNDNKLVLSLSTIASRDLLGDKFTSKSKSIFDTSYLFSDKLKDTDIIPMRISYKLIDIFRHQYIKDTATFNIYDTYTPMRDKQFLDVLTEQIQDEEYKAYRKMLIDAKYDYAYVNSKDVEELKDYDKELEENEYLDLIATLGTIVEYKDKFKTLSMKTLMSPNNKRRLILDINYIRANALSIPEIQLLSLKETIKAEEELTEGMNFFLSIIDLAINEKQDYDENDYPFERKY